MKFVNCTPHAVHFVDSEGNVLKRWEKCLTPARVRTHSRLAGHFILEDGVEIPVLSTSKGKVENLPKPMEDTYYIVSAIVRGAAKDRQDLIIPANFQRDKNGIIIGCQSFSF